jgi:hypothetical protein
MAPGTAGQCSPPFKSRSQPAYWLVSFAYAQWQFSHLFGSTGPPQIISLERKQSEVCMKRYVIERDIPGVGSMTGQQLQGAAAKSNEALAKLGGKAQWIHSYVADNKTFCIYLAEDEAAVREHARISGFPATKVTEISGVIDPTTAK